MDLNTLWFLLLGILLFGYAVLDGFDLGVGIIHLFISKNDTERRLVLNSIGPLWDGNEVWLVTFGGALFAAFPNAYASIFSSYYLPFMLLLFSLIFRATALEFRSKRNNAVWRRSFDIAFSVASTMAALLMGVTVGGTLTGIPIAERGIFQGSIRDLLSPYALLVGLLTVALFALHGAIYLYLKTEGDLQQRLVPWIWRTFGISMILYIFATIATLVIRPQATANFSEYPLAWGVVALNVLAIGNIPRSIFLGKPGMAFISSMVVIMALVALYGLALFPNMVSSSIDPSHSLTIYSAASSDKTLGIMAIIAAIGVPMVLAYTSVVYWTFRGKVQLGEFSY